MESNDSPINDKATDLSLLGDIDDNNLAGSSESSTTVSKVSLEVPRCVASASSTMSVSSSSSATENKIPPTDLDKIEEMEEEGKLLQAKDSLPLTRSQLRKAANEKDSNGSVNLGKKKLSFRWPVNISKKEKKKAESNVDSEAPDTDNGTASPRNSIAPWPVKTNATTKGRKKIEAKAEATNTENAVDPQSSSPELEGKQTCTRRLTELFGLRRKDIELNPNMSKETRKALSVLLHNTDRRNEIEEYTRLLGDHVVAIHSQPEDRTELVKQVRILYEMATSVEDPDSKKPGLIFLQLWDGLNPKLSSLKKDNVFRLGFGIMIAHLDKFRYIEGESFNILEGINRAQNAIFRFN